MHKIPCMLSLQVNATPSLAVEHADPEVEAMIHQQKNDMVLDMVRIMRFRERCAKQAFHLQQSRGKTAAAGTSAQRAVAKAAAAAAAGHPRSQAVQLRGNVAFMALRGGNGRAQQLKRPTAVADADAAAGTSAPALPTPVEGQRPGHEAQLLRKPTAPTTSAAALTDRLQPQQAQQQRRSDSAPSAATSRKPLDPLVLGAATERYEISEALRAALGASMPTPARSSSAPSAEGAGSQHQASIDSSVPAGLSASEVTALTAVELELRCRGGWLPLMGLMPYNNPALPFQRVDVLLRDWMAARVDYL